MTPQHDARIRVLWLIKGLGPGGAEQLLLLSAKVADRDRFEHRLCYVRADKTHLVPEFEAAGMNPVRLGEGSRGRASWLSQLRRELAWADVAHAHSPVLASTARLLVRSLPTRRRPAVLTTEHNVWTSHRTPTRLLNSLTAGLDVHRWAVSEQVLGTMRPGARRGTEVLIHGIDPQAAAVEAGCRARVRTSLGVADDEVLAITVANLRRNKDYPNLLRAAQHARSLEPRLRFIAVGQGPLEGEVRELHANLALGDGFQLLGFRRDVAELMVASDVFVLASAHEGLPVAIMEAFAAGLPVVATTVGGVPQQVREGREGFLVPPRDHLRLAESLVRVAQDADLRHHLAEVARDRASEYDIRAAVLAQERVYAEVAPRR